MTKFTNPVPLFLDDQRQRFFQATGIVFTNEQIVRMILSKVSGSIGAAFNMVQHEYAWIEKRKPFFNLHIPVLRSLANTPLRIKPATIPKSVVDQLGVVCIKLPLGHTDKLLSGITHFFVNTSNVLVTGTSGNVQTEKKKNVSISYQTEDAVFSTSCPVDGYFEDATNEEFDGSIEQTEFEVQQRRYISRLALGVMLLAADPKFIEPILLKRDQGKSVTDDLIDRAHRNGVIGYEIGSKMELSPHFRRPHFAIRWTGKGSEVPRLVHVKGAVIHKSQLEVPTGYEDGESTAT